MSIRAATGNYIAGLLDGEGCFLIAQKTGRADMRAVMRVDLRGDDAPLLHMLCHETGLGNVKRKNSPSMQTEHAVWEVGNKRDCAALVALLDRCPLRGKKAGDYAIWREFVAWWSTRQRGSDWQRGSELRAALIERRRAAP